jgi:hypothetical protein
VTPMQAAGRIESISRSIRIVHARSRFETYNYDAALTRLSFTNLISLFWQQVK